MNSSLSLSSFSKPTNTLNIVRASLGNFFAAYALPLFLSLMLKNRPSYDRVSDINTAHYADRYFQRPATEAMSNIIDFHNDLMVVLIFISVFIVVILSVCLYNYATLSVHEFYMGDEKVNRMNHNTYAEIVFTAVPAIIVYLIAAPSFALLYSNNDWLEKDTDLTVSVTGHQ